MTFIGNITKGRKQRDSNIELLRISAMLLIMIVHADFRALNPPTFIETIQEPYTTFGRLLVESFTIIGVNVFVLISGWYGIRMGKEKLFALFFQILFFIFLCYFAFSIYSGHLVSTNVSYFFMIGEWKYWFIKCYLILFFFSPVLNSFAENASNRQFLIVLICFFVFQTIYGWIGNLSWYHKGYSGISFFGLYLLARYLKLYPCKFSLLEKKWDFIIYIIISLFITILSFYSFKFQFLSQKVTFYYQYDSPLVIISSIYFLLFFTKLNIKFNIVINWIASSCFAIYLLHSNSYFAPYYDSFIKLLYNRYDGLVFIISVMLFIILVFFLSIFIDKVRIVFWNKIRFICETS